MDHIKPISHRADALGIGRHDKLATTDSLPAVEDLPMARAGTGDWLQAACWFLLAAALVVVIAGLLYFVYWEVRVFRVG